MFRFAAMVPHPSFYVRRECFERLGGYSLAGWRSNVEINREDLRALRSHGIWSCLPLIYLKYLFKIWGFVFKK